MKKLKCEARTIGCNGVAVRQYVGRRDKSAKLSICLGCWAVLRRQGLKLKPVAE